MAMTIKNIDYREAQIKLAKLARQMVKVGNGGVVALTHLGVRKEKSIAPQDSGKTARMIRGIFKQKGNGEMQGMVLTPNWVHHGDFNLPRWLNTSPNAERFIQTGEPRYVEKTMKYLNSIKKSTMKGMKQKLIIN